MRRLGFKSVVYHGEVRLGELDVIPVTQHNFRFPNDEIRIHRLSPGERCPPLAVLQTISSFAVRCKLESSSPVKSPELTHLHAACFHEAKTAVVLLEKEEIHLVAMPSKEKKFPCFWCFSVPYGLYDSCLRMLNMRCLSIVFDLDETLIVANTMKSFEDRIEALRAWMAHETDPMRIAGMSAELKRYMDDRTLLKQYTENDHVLDNGVMFKVQHEEVSPLSDDFEKVFRPVIRLKDRNIVLTRINPEIRDTSVLVRLRPAWEDLRCYLTAVGRKRFEVYVCTMAERDYALEVWRLLDPGAHLISPRQLLERVVCVKSGSRKSLLNVFHDGVCHPNMAMIVDDRVKVWEEKDQHRVHAVPAFSPYSYPHAETAKAVPVLCVARNVACNVRGYFFKEFDESLVSSISSVSYENEVVDLPPALDVGNYLTTEDSGCASTLYPNALISEGMSGGEVERRLNQPDYKAAGDFPKDLAKSNSASKTGTPHMQVGLISNAAGITSTSASMASQKPSLLGVPKQVNNNFDGGRSLIMKPGVDLRNQNMAQQPRLSRLPLQGHSSSLYPQGGPLIEQQLIGRPSRNPTSFFSNVAAGSVSNAPQDRNEKECVTDDLKRQKFLQHQLTDVEISQNHANHTSSNGKEHQAEGGRSNGFQSHLFVTVLHEIGKTCGSKVEFRSVVSNSKDLQFSVEVFLNGEKISAGMGKTRKDAQQQAAENALCCLAEKYVSHMPPASGTADDDLGNENGFLWESTNASTNEGCAEDDLPKGNTLGL